MDEFQASTEAGAESDSSPLFVSLFIVLLAFFILLNSVSNIDDKKRRNAMNSILATFDLPRTMDDELSHPSESLDMIAQPLLAALREATASIITIDEMLPELDGNTIRIELDTDELFEMDESIIRADRGFFLQKVFQGLAIPLPGTSVSSEITVGVRNLSNTGTPLAVRRVGVLARLFSGNGISTDNMTIGLSPQYPAKTAFVFYLTPSRSKGAGYVD